jgi:uncharacterized protein (DUF1800 family)
MLLAALRRSNMDHRAVGAPVVALLLAAHAGAAPAPPRDDVPHRAQALAVLRAKYPGAPAGFRLDPMDAPMAPPEGDAAAGGGATAGGGIQAPPGVPATVPRHLAGHLLRHIGFGPTLDEVKQVVQMGWEPYIDQQLNWAAISDSIATVKLPPQPTSIYDDQAWMRRWYTRMVYTKRQLQEKMTLIWHEHFATSNDKVGIGLLMHKQEDLLRAKGLTSFRELLTGVITDQAMLIWLDNDYNDGNDFDGDGNRVLPNANFARELCQLFTMGPIQLHMDGTPITDGAGVPLPSYTEQDIKEIARALTGFHVDYKGNAFTKAIFDPRLHDSRPKTIMGVSLPGRSGTDGINEVGDVVDIILSQPNVAPFISKNLIVKLATETPTPGYVERVATVFASSQGDLKKTIKAILMDPEFVSAAVERSQYKEPIEYFVGPVRALNGVTKGDAFTDWTFLTNQLIYYPPSVFSFYPPGQKRTLINTALLTYRDRSADSFVAGFTDTKIDAPTLIKNYHLTTPDTVADFLGATLLTSALQPALRQEVLTYMAGTVTERKLRGAIWLVMCSADFQRN